jgi:5-methylcytosine-specific restriction endonuclease McrA
MQFHHRTDWRHLRYQVLQQTPYCQCCGRRPPEVVLHVDHIQPRYFFPELAMQITNLQVLCKDCNFGKSAWDQTDWRINFPEDPPE